MTDKFSSLEGSEPIHEHIESYKDDRELSPTATKEAKLEEKLEKLSSQKTISAEDAEAYKELKAEIEAEGKIIPVIEARPQGDETWTDERSQEDKKPWYLRVAAMLGVAGVMAVPHKSEAKDFGDTTVKKATTSTHEAKISSPEKITAIREGKKVGDITIEGRYLLPYRNNTSPKEVCVVYVSGNEKDKNKAAKIIAAMRQDGSWEPADGELLEEVAKQNGGDFSKKMPSVMSLVPEGDANDMRSLEATNAIIKEDGREKIKKVLPEHAVYPTRSPVGPGRFEVDQDITYSKDDYGYIFYRKSTTAQYESGLAKSK